MAAENFNEQKQVEDDFHSCSDEEFHEHYCHEEFERQQGLNLQRDFKHENNIDTSHMELYHSMGHPDSSLRGKLFVGGVSWDTTEETFTEYFRNYGELTDSVIIMDKHSGRSRGFGFVTFADPGVADKVLEEYHVVDGRVVKVKRTVPRVDMDVKELLRTKKIFVGGIPPYLTEEELKEYFSFYGSIIEHQIMLDHTTGRSRGFGFVTFESEDAVEKIFSEGKLHELGRKQVEIKRAEPKRGGSDCGGNTAASCGYGRYISRGQFNGEMVWGQGGHGIYGPFGSYCGNYCGSYASLYGGYGYGFGYVGPTYMNTRYGENVYGIPGNHGSAAGYGEVKAYGIGSSSGFDGYKGYQWGSVSMTGRYHPYWI